MLVAACPEATTVGRSDQSVATTLVLFFRWEFWANPQFGLVVKRGRHGSRANEGSGVLDNGLGGGLAES